MDTHNAEEDACQHERAEEPSDGAGLDEAPPAPDAAVAAASARRTRTVVALVVP